MDDVVYVPHPVSPELKAKIRGEGKRILDAIFAPEGAEIYGAVVEAEVVAPRRGRPPKVEAPVEPVATETDAASIQ